MGIYLCIGELKFGSLNESFSMSQYPIGLFSYYNSDFNFNFLFHSIHSLLLVQLLIKFLLQLVSG